MHALNFKHFANCPAFSVFDSLTISQTVHGIVAADEQVYQYNTLCRVPYYNRRNIPIVLPTGSNSADCPVWKYCGNSHA